MLSTTWFVDSPYTRPWQTYQFSFFKPYISITPLNYWQSTDNSIKWWASSSMEKFGIPQKLQTSKCQKKIFFLKKKPNSQLFLRFLAILVTLKLPWCSIKTKNSSSYSIKIKSVWLWFPTSPWMNLWMIFLNSLINSSRELYNSFCGHETFKKSPSQGRVLFFPLDYWRLSRFEMKICQTISGLWLANKPKLVT